MKRFHETEEYLDKIQKTLEFFTDKRQVLEFLMDYGKDLPAFPDELKTPGNKVPGCVSGVYIASETDEHGRMHYQGCSESHIVKGYVKLLITTLNGLTLEEIHRIRPRLEEFSQATKLNASMLASRASAFGNIFETMLEQASR